LTNEIKALKKIKLPGTFATDGFPMTSVREINLLLALDHPHIVRVSEIVIGKKRDVYMVMEFVQQDLKAFLAKYKARLKIGEVRVDVVWSNAGLLNHGFEHLYQL
jgi:cell division cycle 2-like